ncbi:MAG: hypothetical protein ACON4Z_15640 [Planctomycetota bacterium]
MTCRRALRSSFLCLALLPWAAGCSVGATGQVGYALVEVGGDLGLDRAGGAVSGSQDVDEAFGLGDAQGSPYVRGQLDTGGLVVTGSALLLQESGQGALTETFGGLAAGTSAAADLELGVLKVSAAYDIDLGLAKIAPGVMCDVMAFDLTARDVASGLQESVDELVFAPMPFVRAEVGFGPVEAVGEVGYLDFSGLGDTEGAFLDVEVLLEWHPVPLPFAHLFVGYRHVDLDGSADAGGDLFSADLQLQGWTIGGGLRF